MLEENKVLSDVRSGNTEAFKGIIDEYQLPIQRYLFRFTDDYEAARDIAQDTFLKAYKGILKEENIINLRAWLYRIATNNAIEYKRRKRLFSGFMFNQQRKQAAAINNSETQLYENMAVNEAFCEVPGEQRSCLELAFIEGFKYRDIGEILGISEEAVRKRIARGRQAFIKAYAGGEAGTNEM